MMINKVAICPICGKKTWLRIQDGGYLNEYPIRVNCMNCRALIKGTYVMEPNSNMRGLNMVNAEIEECDAEQVGQNVIVKNAEYIAEISGELPCYNVRKYEGDLPLSPFMRSTNYLEDVTKRIDRLSYFATNMKEWKKQKSIAFQLLDEGSIEYIATALKNKMGNYQYECDNYLKALHCLQEVVLEETKYLFVTPTQDECIVNLFQKLALLDQEKILALTEQMGGIEGIVQSYKKAIEVFSNFMRIYPNILPAETYIWFTSCLDNDMGIATCSFADLKSFYQDAYESLMSLFMVPVCLDNINERDNYISFEQTFKGLFRQKKFSDCTDDYQRYLILDNGMKIKKINTTSFFQKEVNIPANRFLRNGIGHNNIKYDGLTQTISAYDLKDHDKINYETSLMNMAIDCIGLAKASVTISEMLLFLLRLEFRKEGIRSIVHPRIYKGAEPNFKCPCGSGIKYKKCCKKEFELLKRSNNP